MTTFDPDTLTLEAERDRLDAKLDDLADDLMDTTAGSEGVAMLKREARETDQAGRAVASLIERYDAEAEIRVRGLNAGEYAEVQNRTADARQQATAQGGLPGTGRLIYAAAGLVDAPFYDGEADDLDAKIETVADQPIGVLVWVESLVDDRGTVDEGNWRSLADRLQDRLTEA